MALPALIVAAIARIRAANNNAYDAVSNPAGLGQGGQRQNFVPDINAVADIGVFAGECVDKADADVALTHEDAANTKLDRIQTGQDVLATLQARADALAFRNQAQAAAAGVSLPAITAADAGKALVVGADGKYKVDSATPSDKSVTLAKLSDDAKASPAQIAAGSGTGLLDVSGAAALIDTFGAPIGAGLLMTKAPGPNFLRADGKRYLKSAYPKLAAVMRPTLGVSVSQVTVTGFDAGASVDSSSRTFVLGKYLYTAVYDFNANAFYFYSIDLTTMQAVRSSTPIPSINTSYSPVAMIPVNSTTLGLFYATDTTVIFNTVNLSDLTFPTSTSYGTPTGGSGQIIIKIASGAYLKAVGAAVYRSVNNAGVLGTASTGIPNGVIRGMVEYEPDKILVATRLATGRTQFYKSENGGVSFVALGPSYGNQIYTYDVAAGLFVFGGKVYAIFDTVNADLRTGMYLVTTQNGDLTYVGAHYPRASLPFLDHLIITGAAANAGAMDAQGNTRAANSIVVNDVSPYGELANASQAAQVNNVLNVRNSSVYNGGHYNLINRERINKAVPSYDPATELMLPVTRDDIYVRAY